MELKTQKQMNREKRNADIVAKYKEMRDAYPEATDNLIFKEIAKGYNIDSPAIRTICKANGVC